MGLGFKPSKDMDPEESGAEASSCSGASEDCSDGNYVIESDTSSSSSSSSSSTDEDEHRKQRSLECHVCGKSTKKPSLLQQHLQSHSAEKPFTCPVNTCFCKYKRKDHLDRHIREKHDIKCNVQKCSWPGCTFTCTSASNFERHKNLHAKKGRLQRCRDRSKEEQKLYSCHKEACKKAFRYRSALQYHEETCHEKIFVDVICSEPGCAEHFDDPRDLSTHMRNAHKYIFCEVCGKVCLRKNIKRHYRSHDNAGVEKERLRCPYKGCLHSFTQENNLRKHMKVTHLEFKPYGCSHKECGKVFAYKHVRDKHEKTVHVSGDFLLEDLQHTRKNKGGRKRKVLESIDDIFKTRKNRRKEKQSCD